MVRSRYCEKHKRELVDAMIGGQFDAPHLYTYCPACSDEARMREFAKARRRERVEMVRRAVLGVSAAAVVAAPLLYVTAHSRGYISWLAGTALGIITLFGILWLLFVLWTSWE